MKADSKAFVWALLLTVTALFFFPLTFGSFQSTHGPTTTPETRAAVVCFAILVLGSLLFGYCRAELGRRAQSVQPLVSEKNANPLPASSLPLLC
jgi:hypothetical protein